MQTYRCDVCKSDLDYRGGSRPWMTMPAPPVVFSDESKVDMEFRVTYRTIDSGDEREICLNCIIKAFRDWLNIPEMTSTATMKVPPFEPTITKGATKYVDRIPLQFKHPSGDEYVLANITEHDVSILKMVLREIIHRLWTRLGVTRPFAPDVEEWLGIRRPRAKP